MDYVEYFSDHDRTRQPGLRAGPRSLPTGPIDDYFSSSRSGPGFCPTLGLGRQVSGGGGTQKPVGNDWSTAASCLRRSTQGACPPTQGHPGPSTPPLRKHQGRCLGLLRVTKGVRKGGGVPPFSHKDRKSFDFCFAPFHYTHATLTREL